MLIFLLIEYYEYYFRMSSARLLIDRKHDRYVITALVRRMSYGLPLFLFVM